MAEDFGGEGGCGLLSRPGHPECMARDILRVLDSPELARTLAGLDTDFDAHDPQANDAVSGATP